MRAAAIALGERAAGLTIGSSTIIGGSNTFVAWGDSLTAGNEDGTGVTYPGVLSTLYTPPRIVLNNGIGGQTSSQILTRFQAAANTWGNSSLIWAGENNYNNGTQVQADIASMVGDLTTINYIIFAILNGEGLGTGTGSYNTIIALNNALASTYGVNWFDVRAMLVAAYSPANPIDVINHANDIPPFTLRAVDETGTIVGSINSSTTTFVLSPTSSATVVANSILTVGTEYIYILGTSGNTVTSCTRGYAGSTAISYSAGQTYIGTDPTHPNAAGYTLIAKWVYNKIQVLGGWA